MQVIIPSPSNRSTAALCFRPFICAKGLNSASVISATPFSRTLKSTGIPNCPRRSKSPLHFLPGAYSGLSRLC